MTEPLSNCCYAPLSVDGDSSQFLVCTACGQLADPATDVAKELNDPGERHYCKWCERTTDHVSSDCPIKRAQVEAATHQL